MIRKVLTSIAMAGALTLGDCNKDNNETIPNQNYNTPSSFEARVYYHAEGINGREEVPTTLLPYHNARVLVRHDEEITIVVGRIGDRYRQMREHPLPHITDVTPITDETERKEISDLLKAKGKPISFW